ncbi:MAG TPA: FecR domain-containing protein [Chitinophagaceae bacterium]
MQPNDRFRWLFRRYMAKTCTSAEKDELMDFMSQPGYDALLRELLRRGSEELLPVYEQEPEKADAIFSAIVDRQQVPARRMGPGFVLRVAAAALIILAVGLGAWYFLRPRQQPAASLAVVHPAPVTPREHSYLLLPDGSKVLLNAGSTLHYPPAFKGATREVYLSGEAYFDIHHNPRQPFIVHAGNVKTVVLGTAFNIKAFPGQRNVVVTVTRGRVRVENETKMLGILTRDEQLTVTNDKTEHPAKQVVKPEEVMSWKADDILFDDEPVSGVVAELQRRFAVSVRLENPALGNCRVTASFLHHETAEEIIKVICGINHMQYRVDDDKSIALDGEGCP